jgi:hypothetical protein
MSHKAIGRVLVRSKCRSCGWHFMTVVENAKIFLYKIGEERSRMQRLLFDFGNDINLLT